MSAAFSSDAPFALGDDVTTDFYPGDSERIRVVKKISRSRRCEKT